MPPGKDRLEALKTHYRAVGLSTREHGNHKRLPHNVLSFEEMKNFVKFLQQYAEANVILLPGRILGCRWDDIQLLPSHTTEKVMCMLDEPFIHRTAST